MNSALGSAALVIGLIASIGTLVVSIIAARTSSERLRKLSRLGIYLSTAAVVLASAVLVHAFVTHDFSIKYVQRYSDERMPVVYLISAFWGGQPGSLLFWNLVLLVFAAFAVRGAQHRSPEIMPWVHAVLAAVGGFFFILLIFITSPFETFQVINTPQTGHGLNPLLQNYWMAIHPPCLLSGYATAAVPMAFGVGALLAGRQDVDWIKLTRKWLLITWLFLSVGNLLGGRWAYEELGWGGYWAWDPVENAAILPWFTSTALLHSVMVQQHRGMLKRWNIFLLLTTFWLTIFGTFLTRSGVLESVHTFAESGIGPWFFGLVIFIIVGGAALMIWRWDMLTPSNRLESATSREQMFLLNNWVFLAFTFIVLWGTTFPKINQMLSGQDSAIGPPWFNQFAFPLGLVLLALMALGTLFAWRRGSARRVKRNIKIPLLITLVAVPLVIGLYYMGRLQDLAPGMSPLSVTYAIIALVLVVFNLAVIADEFGRGLRARRKRVGGGPVTSLYGLIRKHRRRYGGYLVHVGFVLLAFGISGNAFKISQQATLRAGESVPLGDYLVTFEGVELEQHSDKLAYFATLSLRSCDRAEDGSLTDCGDPSIIRPARFDYNDYANLTGQPDPSKLTSEVAILMTPLEDVYVAPSGMNPQDNIASFEMFINPFTFWVWFGGIVLAGATIICMWPERSKVRVRARLGKLRPAFGPMGVLLLAAIPAIAFLMAAVADAQEPPAPSRAEPAATEQAPAVPTGAQNVGSDEHDHDHDHAPAAGGTASADGLVTPVRTDGSDAEAIFAQVNCRCPGCGGKTLAQCPATCGPGRHDRAMILEWLAEGHDSDEVLDLIVAEYGESALAIPRAPVTGYVLPILGVLLGIVALYFASRALRRGQRRASERRVPLAAGANGGSLPAGSDLYEKRLARELRELD